MLEQPVPLPAPLARRGVALWQVGLDTADPDMAPSMLGPRELQRWQALRCPRAAAAYLRLRASLRRLLLRHGGIDIAGRSLAYGPHGKPSLPAGGPPWFNLSHSGGQACIALSTQAEIGVDIERHTPAMPPAFPAAGGVFTAHERAHMARNGASGFYRIWTRKEAVLKALGLGFATDARMFCVAPPPIEGCDGALCATTRLWSIASIAGCSVAVACIEPTAERRPSQ